MNPQTQGCCILFYGFTRSVPALGLNPNRTENIAPERIRIQCQTRTLLMHYALEEVFVDLLFHTFET